MDDYHVPDIFRIREKYSRCDKNSLSGVRIHQMGISEIVKCAMFNSRRIQFDFFLLAKQASKSSSSGMWKVHVN